MVNTIKDNGGGPRLAELAFSGLCIALNKAFNEEILHRLPFKTVSLPKKFNNRIGNTGKEVLLFQES